MNYNLQDAFRIQRGEMPLPVDAIKPPEDYMPVDLIKSPQHQLLAEKLIGMLSPELMSGVARTRGARPTATKIVSRN